MNFNEQIADFQSMVDVINQSKKEIESLISDGKVEEAMEKLKLLQAITNNLATQLDGTTLELLLYK
jgi:hypothetical protein